MEKITNVEKYLVSNLKINVASAADYSGVYDARVEEADGDSLLISIPSDRGVPMSVRPGAKVEIAFISTGGRFTFTTSVKGVVVKNISMLELEKPPFIMKSELREFFRVEVGRNITIHSMVRNMKTGKMVRDAEYQVICADISGGGARLVSSSPMGGVYEVEADFSAFIPGLDSVPSAIVRYGENRDGKYDIGIKFTSLRDSDRDNIVKFVFKRQIELRVLKNR